MDERKAKNIFELIQIYYLIERNESSKDDFYNADLERKLTIIQERLNDIKKQPVGIATLLANYRNRTNELITTFETIL